MWLTRYFEALYDNVGRIQEIGNTLIGMSKSVTFGQEFDDLSRRTVLSARLVQGGSVTTDFANRYQYDALSRMTRIEQSKWSAANPPITVQGGWTEGNLAEKRIDITYNAMGQFDTITRYKDLDGGAGNEVITSTYKHDPLARLVNLEHKKTGSAAVNNYTFTYNTLNRLTSMNSVDGLVNYSYDGTGQIISADHASQTDESYVHDLNGNRVTANGSTYATGTDNRLTNDGTHTYTYDKEGNRTSRTTIATGEVTEYIWDHRNRMTTVRQRASAGGTIQWQVDYAYDAFDRMVNRALDADGQGAGGAVTTFLVYDGLSIVLALSSTGAVDRRLLWGPGSDQLLASEDSGGVDWTLGDHLGTIRDVVDSTGTLITHRQYDSFGNLISGTTDPGWYLGFTGRFFDLQTGLQWNWQRWYDPKTGRWLSTDPIGFAAGDANMYRYVGNQPTGFTDPFGTEENEPRQRPRIWNEQLIDEAIKEIGYDNFVELYYQDMILQVLYDRENLPEREISMDPHYFVGPRGGAIACVPRYFNGRVVGSVGYTQTIRTPTHGPSSAFVNRIVAAVQIAAGVAETITGTLLATSGVGTVPGAVIAVHGADNVGTGFIILWTGQDQRTQSSQALDIITHDPVQSERIETALFLAYDLGAMKTLAKASRLGPDLCDTNKIAAKKRGPKTDPNAPHNATIRGNCLPHASKF